ncbi:MAG: LpqN/LpqT family lipoprotein [Mycobacterium sp.]
MPRTVAQTSVVISGRDGPYLLQINAEGPEADFDALKAASLVIAERTTIRP